MTGFSIGEVPLNESFDVHFEFARWIASIFYENNLHECMKKLVYVNLNFGINKNNILLEEML